MNLILRCISLITIVVASSGLLHANNGGRTGLYAAGCGNCHGGSSAATNVTLDGPRSVRAGQTVDYAVVVAHNAHQNAGFNATFRLGGAAAGTMLPGAGQLEANGEIYHNGKKSSTNTTVRFDFQWVAPAAHGTYTFNAAGNAVNNDGNDTDADDWNVTGNINITVTGATFTGPAQGTSVCRGTSVTFNWTQTGLGQVRIEWSKNNFATTETLATSMAASTQTLTYNIPGTQDPGDYIVRMVDIATGVEIARTGPVNVVGSPVITLNPATTLVCEGRQLQLTVAATGANLQYRWRRDGVDIPGGTNAVLTINQVNQTAAGVYDCVIFGCGGNTTSQPATVSIGVKPAITLQPVAATLCEGGDVRFTITATGTDITYQWIRNGATIPEATTNELLLSKVTQFDEAKYACIVRGACTPELTSTEVQLNVTEPPGIRTEPVDRNLRAGDSLILTFETRGENLSYQWYRNGLVLAGANQRLYRKTNITRADSGQYECRVLNTCDTVFTRKAVVKVTAAAGPGQLELTSAGLTLEGVPSCGSIDTTITGLLVNEGGSPITITSISASPTANISVRDLVAPFTLEPNERRDVRLSIEPRQSGTFSGTVSFFAQSGTRIFNVSAEAVTGLAFAQDTVVFAEGVNADRRCVTSVALPCPVTEVRRIRLTGPGASSWRNVSVLNPTFTIQSGTTVDLCFETTAETGADATVVVETESGDASFVLTRRVITSVDEEVEPASAIRIAPNPMTDELRITSPFEGAIAVRIVDVTGNTMALLGGTGDVVWDRRDRSGTTVAPGLYVVIVEQRGLRRYEKVLVR